MRVLHAGIFQDHCLGGNIVLRSGFQTNGIEHHEFDYRIIAQQSGIGEMNKRLVDLTKGHDLLFIGKGELITAQTLSVIRRNGTAIALWYGDIRSKPESWLLDNLSQCDVLFMTSAGDALKCYFQMGKPKKAAYFLNPSCPDLVKQFENVPRSVDPPLFTGTSYEMGDPYRRMTIEYLRKRGDVRLVGFYPWFAKHEIIKKLYRFINPNFYPRGGTYIHKIIRAKFGIGVSAFQNIKYYTSDRLTHYLTFGKLFLAWRFPGCEALFEDGKEIKYFDGIDELGKMITYYFERQNEAESIGIAGQKKILSSYNAHNMIKMMLEIIARGKSDMFPWVEVLG